MDLNPIYKELLQRVKELETERIKRKSAEKALREKEIEKTALLNAMSEVVAFQDLDMKLVWANRAAGESVGISPDKLIGRHCYEIWHQRDEPCSDCPVIQARETGLPRSAEVISPDARVWFIRGYPVRDSKNDIVGIVEVTLEISEKKRAEDALRESEERFRLLYETSLDIIRSQDLTTLLETIVERAAQLLDCTSGGMYLCDPDREEARCLVSYKTPFDFTGTILKYGEGAAGIVAQTGKPLIVNDYRKWPNRAAVFEKDQPFQAVISSPMIWQEKVIGVIHVLHATEARHFTQQNLELLTLFANQAATTIRNAELIEQALSDAAKLQLQVKEIEKRTVELTKMNKEYLKEIEERKKVQRSLQNSEMRYRTLFEQSPDAIVVINPATTLPIDFNQAAPEMLKCSKEEFSKLRISDYEAIESCEEIQEHVEKALNLGGDEFETKFRAQNGETINVLVKIKVLELSGKKVLHNIFKDISERKQMEERLREHTSMLEDIFKEAADGICMCHNISEEPYVSFTHWNSKMTEITGYTMAEINQLGWYQTMYPDPNVQELAIERMREMREGDDIQGEEWVITTKNGEERPLSISTSIVKTEDEKIHVLAIMHDIGERKRAELALKESEQRFVLATRGGMSVCGIGI